MSLGRSSRFCFLGPAKVKSETVLSSFASASLPPIFIIVVCCVARILDTDIGKTLMNMEMLKFLRARTRKIIPCLVFNKVIHIIHSNPGMPFYRTPPNDRLRIALAWYGEFRWSFPIEFLSDVIKLDEDLKSKDVKINMKQWINIFEKDSWIVKIVLALCPLCLLTSRLESRVEILI